MTLVSLEIGHLFRLKEKLINHLKLNYKIKLIKREVLNKRNQLLQLNKILRRVEH
jgi:hypothetical protein